MIKDDVDLLNKHISIHWKTCKLEFVALEDLRERITKRHPTFSMDTQRILEYLELNHGEKPERYKGVKGFMIGTDGQLLAPETGKARPDITKMSVLLEELEEHYKQRPLGPNDVSRKDYKDLLEDLESIKDITACLDYMKEKLEGAVSNYTGRNTFVCPHV